MNEELPLESDQRGNFFAMMAVDQNVLNADSQVKDIKAKSKLLKSIDTAKNDTSEGQLVSKNLSGELSLHVQNITKHIYPLSHTMEYLPEDVESMNRESTSWDPLVEKYRSDYEKECKETRKLITDTTREKNELNLRISKLRDQIKAMHYNLNHMEDSELKVFKSISESY
eukprot:NODE_283_length_10814_cov_0.705460.p9 type:complete len:170 gc:universal NODE_283_length_10814_cov_0.705460:3587-4096(+)